MIDKSKFDDYATALFGEIIRRHPDWSENADNGNPDSDSGFTISIYFSDKEKSPIKIYGGGDVEALAIQWGELSLDYYSIPQLQNPKMFYPSIDEVADVIDEIVSRFLKNV
jgi:hypothetical protein